MRNDPIYHTPTMAKLLARQGKLSEAAEIYRHLIGLDPRMNRYHEDLVEVEARLKARTGDRVKAALSRWMSILTVHKRYQNLREIRQNRAPRVPEG